MSDPSVMLLNEQEWTDLAAIVGEYLRQCEHVCGDAGMTIVTRRLELCDRIVKAAS